MDIFILTETKGLNNPTTTVVGAFQQLGSAIDFSSDLADVNLHFERQIGVSEVYFAEISPFWSFTISPVAVMDA